MTQPDREQPTDSQHPALSPTRPLFIDHRDGNTLDRAIARHLGALRREMALPWEVCIATAFFNVPGFNLLADELEQIARVRLLLVAEPTPEAVAPTGGDCWRRRSRGRDTARSGRYNMFVYC